MFGYVRPLRCELRVREDETFRAVYCGLCHTLKQEYGFAARFILNYDFTFLAMVLTKTGGACQKRCVASPLRKKKVALRDPGLSSAAAASVICTWWKLCDEIRDQTGIRRLGARAVRLLFRRPYRRAKEKLAGYDRMLEQSVAALQALEERKETSMDAAADTFAGSLGELALLAPEEERRPLRELFYHIGRWIYLMDAADDLKEDLASGNYNPLALRYGLTAAPLKGEALKSLDVTARHSLYLASTAWALLPPRPCGAIIENILCYGLPTVQRQVLSGTYRKKKNNRDEDRSFA